MVDYDTLVAKLKACGYAVEHVIPVPENAGDAQFLIAGKLLTLTEVRQLLADAEERPAG